MGGNKKHKKYRHTLLPSVLGILAVFTWYGLDKALYDASVGTFFQRIFDILAFVIFLPLDASWYLMYRTGLLPMKDYTHELLAYYATGGIYFVCLGSWLGFFTRSIIRKIRKP